MTESARDEPTVLVEVADGEVDAEAVEQEDADEEAEVAEAVARCGSS